MSRHYPLFSSRAKARRENFASTRKSLPQSWEESFPSENAPFTVLPSPTIGDDTGIPERLASALSPLAREGQSQSSSNVSSGMTPSTSGKSGSSSGYRLLAQKSIAAGSPSSLLCSALSEGKIPSGEKPHRKWSPRLRIVRQLSQPVLKIAEIIETKHANKGNQSTSSNSQASTATTSGKISILTKYPPSCHSPSYDWSKDVSTQCNIFQSPSAHPPGEGEPVRDRDGSTMAKATRQESLRRSRSLDCEDFSQSGWDPEQKSVTEVVKSGKGDSTGKPASIMKSTKPGLDKDSEVFIRHGAIPPSFQDDFPPSPPLSPRRFGARALPSIFSFPRDKMNSGSKDAGAGTKGSGVAGPSRKPVPPSHLNLFGTQTSPIPTPIEVTTVFEKTVCKKCAVLMPHLAGGQTEMIQQQTQTDFGVGEPCKNSPCSITSTTSTVTIASTSDTSKAGNLSCINVHAKGGPTSSGPMTTVAAQASTNVSQTHSERLMQSQPVMSRPQHHVMLEHGHPEKKYVPSPLAAEKWKTTSDHGVDHPAQIHQHHHHHHQPCKKHSLAFSLPIPQLALQYANIPSGDSVPLPVHSGLPAIPQCGSHQRGNYDSAPTSRSSSTAAPDGTEGRGKSSTLPTIDSKHIVALRSAEKKRRFFAKKQTNSAPDTYDSHTFLTATQGVLHTTRRLCGNCKEPVTNCLDGVLRATRREKSDTSAFTPPSVEVWESEIRTARCGDVAVTHVSELDYPDADPPCHFCCEQASTAIHDASRLQIVSGGLVRSRDGSTRSGSAPYINLPSPNVQAENGQQGVFPSLSLSPSMSQTLSPGSHYDHPSILERSSPPTRCGSLAGASRGSVASMKEEEESLVGPPASSLTRRPAIVPPKLYPDPDYENDTDRDKNSCRSSDDSTSPRARRSSIVVIPPMQICPGDLLVYGKCLSQRKSLLGTTIETPSPIQNMLEAENTSRKGKTTWSLLKLFDRTNRPKGGPSGAIEEIMSLIQPCDYSDPKLTRFKGMCWPDFVNHVANQKAPKDQGGDVATLKSDLVLSNLPSGGSGGEVAAGIIHSTINLPSSTTSGKDDKSTRSPKPLVRKRIGLMRTMSDRCLERRITPALFRGTQGFLIGEKLVEGKETESPADTPTTTTSKGGKSSPLNAVKSDKDSDAGNKENTSSSAGAGNASIPQQPPPEESASDPDLRRKMRQKEALWDLFQSECSFLYDHLMVLKNVFLEPLKRIQVEGIAMYAEPELLFGNLDELCGVTYAFCKEFIHLLLKLTDAAGELSTTEVLGKLFEPSSKARAMSQAYHRYALNYINALNYLETLRRQQEFNEFEKLCMKDPRCKKLQLTDLLVSPVQHIMKVPLILKDIQCRTSEPQEKELIVQILEIQENSIRELDDKMRWLKNYERLLEIQRNIVWPSILEMEPKTWVPEFLRVALGRQPCDSIIVSPRRQIIHEGLLQLWDTGKPSETYVILFDDMLLITRRKKGLSKKKSSLTENWQSACGKSGSVVGSGLETNHRYIVYRQPISLDRFFIHDIAEAENTSAKLDYAFVLVALNRFQQIVSVHTFQAPSESVKNLWLLKLKTTQEKWKRTLQTTVFRGVRSSTDSGQSNVASSLVFGLNKQFTRHNEA